ncbi:MAG: SRPBCC domain-containing protein [Longimicrobiales bacterium]
MTKTTTEDRTIERRLEFDAPVERVWHALTDVAELGSWFSDEADFEARPGYEGSVTWHEHGTFAVRVEVAEPPHRLVWQWLHEAGAPFRAEAATRVEWTLTPGPDGGTVLELRESGFRTDLHHRENQEGWTSELGHLRTFLQAAPGSRTG